MTITLDSPLRTRFPFPFVEDKYRYSTNVEPAELPVPTPVGQWGEQVLDADSEYQAELAERAEILAADPSRSALLPHMIPASWDAMLTLMRELVATRPEEFSLVNEGDQWQWENKILGISQSFIYGNAETLPTNPLDYICSQVQEDVVLLDQRDGQLFADAGVVTFAADWSFGFDVGMSFLEIHGPVPRVRKEGVITRAHEFLKTLQPHRPYRRTNWTMSIGRRLDVSTERYPEWGRDREMIQQVDDETFGRLVHLRVEVQHLIRLPDSGAVIFLIRTYMLPLEALATVEPWRIRTAEVLAELPEDMADYKGVIKYKDRAAAWLRDFVATPPTSPGTTSSGTISSSSNDGALDEAPGDGLPAWPTSPAAIDPSATSYLVLAVGAEPATSEVARSWVTAAEAVAPTRMLVLDSLANAEDQDLLTEALAQAKTGVRIYVTGGQYDVMQALTVCRDAGAIAAELTAFVTHTRDLPLYCAQCRATYQVEGSPGEQATCPGCERTVEIHEHHSATLGNFLASSPDQPSPATEDLTDQSPTTTSGETS